MLRKHLFSHDAQQYMIRRFSRTTKNYFVSTASFFVYQWMQINAKRQKFYKMTTFIQKFQRRLILAQNFRTNYMSNDSLGMKT